MIKPVNSDSLNYEDDLIKSVFNIQSNQIEFALFNKTNSTIKIIWDESAVVINGITYKVAHKNVKFSEMSVSHPPTVVPPDAVLNDIIIPVDFVKYVEKEGWKTMPFFEGNSNGLYKLGALLMLTVNGKPKEYYFVFDVNYFVTTTTVNYAVVPSNDYSTMKLENEYRNGYSLKSSKSVSETWDLVHALLKEKGFELQEDKSRYYILAQNDKLKNAYCAEIGKGQLSSYDKYVVVTRCYSRSTDSFAPVTDLKASWQVQVMEEKGGTVVLIRMDNYSINRRTQKEILCTDAEVRSTGLLEKQIGEAVR